ncbi:MAG: tetratricopeptide repeat protein [Verrucomicrobia bacterium]|nr:tetratricopeptide repeat protein [Verrucomicrobiota bacterium]
MSPAEISDLIEDATLDFTLGDHEAALKKLDAALEADPQSFAGWHAKAEILFDLRQLDQALEAAEKALALDAQDIHIHTSLSRIWMERGDKAKAEHHGAQARILGWKEQLRSEKP